MSSTIVTVLKSGGDFRTDHVTLLHSRLGNLPSLCLTDYNEIPGVKTQGLKHNYRGWWSKLELFDPSHNLGNILFIDIDTVIISSLDGFLSLEEFTMLSDFYHPEVVASGAMFIPEKVKKPIWDLWSTNPIKWMQQFRGDQDFIAYAIKLLELKVERFNNSIASYKKHVANSKMLGYNRYSIGNGKIPEGTIILCFHGKPRPWDVDLDSLM